MGQAAKRLIPGVAALAMAASVLLLSDLESRRPPAQKQLRLSLLQHASQAILDEGYQGFVDALREAGYIEGQTIAIQRFNAEGDVATSHTMAQAIVSSGCDLAVSMTTPSLQSLAAANREGQVRHLFSFVTDPSASGVGVGKDPGDHPAWMTGLGTMQPVEKTLELARQMNPQLKRLGVVWNAAEINSEITVRIARKVCADLDIELLEANAENTASVREAANSLVSRGVQALWIGADVTVLSAADSIIAPARQAHLPVFTSIPGNAPKGPLFDLGANYYDVGHRAGELAARILGGESPEKIPVEAFVPPELFLNLTALEGLRDKWTVSEELRASADVVIDATGTHENASRRAQRKESGPSTAPLAKKWRVRILEYVNVTDVEESERGVLDGLREAGLVAGRDFEYEVLNAQGDMATLSGLVDAAITAQADLIITMSTPTLQTALRRVSTTPIVFTFLADPGVAGAGSDDRKHLPNVTGSYGSGDVDGMVSIIRQSMPHAKRVGAMYSPNEVNSVFNHERFVKAAKAGGLEVEVVGVNTPSEVADAALSLCNRPIDLVCVPTSNLTASTFPSIIQAAKRAKRPVFTFLGGLADQGAAVCLARDYYDLGHDAGGLAARVMRGEPVAQIPFQPATTSRLILNLPAARECGLEFSEELRQQAARVIDH